MIKTGRISTSLNLNCLVPVFVADNLPPLAHNGNMFGKETITRNSRALSDVIAKRPWTCAVSGMSPVQNVRDLPGPYPDRPYPHPLPGSNLSPNTEVPHSGLQTAISHLRLTKAYNPQAQQPLTHLLPHICG
jgi:hypothetical protein